MDLFEQGFMVMLELRVLSLCAAAPARLGYAHFPGVGPNTLFPPRRIFLGGLGR
jgi:hypothetical protein